jgi:hypothetical protein
MQSLRLLHKYDAYSNSNNQYHNNDITNNSTSTNGTENNRYFLAGAIRHCFTDGEEEGALLGG